LGGFTAQISRFQHILPLSTAQINCSGSDLPFFRKPKLIGKIFFGHIALVAAADHEFVDAKAALGDQGVPQNRPTTNFHRWLGHEAGFHADASTQAAGQDQGVHERTYRRGISRGKGFGQACCQLISRPTSGPTAGWVRLLGRQRRLKAGRNTVFKWSR
jgi:hypothetical protein